MKHRPTSEQFREQLIGMVDTLRREIIDGTYAVGGQLPSEKLLAARFNLSNNSVRKGLEMLVEEGFVEKIPRVGNRVKSVQAGSKPVTLMLGCTETASRNLDLPVLLEDIHRQYPWITIKPVKYTGTIASDDDEWAGAMDLVLLDNSQFEQLLEHGQVPFLESLSSREGMYPFLDSLFTVEGRHLMQPVVFSPIVLCYNKAHFRACGLEEPDGSWTWTDLIRHAEQLSDGKGRYGFGVHIQDMNRWPIFLLQSGERFEWDDGQLRELRGTRMLQSIRTCKSIIHNREASPLFLTENSGDTVRMFEEGKLTMVLNSYMGLNVWRNTNMDYDVTPLPFLYEPRTLLICLGIGILEKTAHKEEAQLVADYFGSARARNLIAKHTLSIPALRPLPPPVSGGGIRRPDRYMLYRDMLFSCRTHRDLNIPPSAFPKLFQQLSMYWANMIDEDELCDRIRDVLSVSGTSRGEREEVRT